MRQQAPGYLPMTKHLILLFTLLLVSGCSNMGNLSRTQHVYNNQYITIHEPAPIKSTECPKYLPLPTYFAPEVPLDRLRQAASKSDHDVVLAMTRYIKELRENIAQRKKDEQAHYDNYLKNCSDQLK